MAEQTDAQSAGSFTDVLAARLYLPTGNRFRIDWQEAWAEGRSLRRYPLLGLVSRKELRRALNRSALIAGFVGIALVSTIFIRPQLQSEDIINVAPIASEVSDQPSVESLQGSKESKFDKGVASQVLILSKEELSNKRVLAWKGIVENVVDDPRLNIPQQDKTFWVNRILATSKLESNGIADAVADTNYSQFVDEDQTGLGPTQITPKTARAIASKYQISEYNLLKTWDNFFLGTAYQIELAQMFGKDLAGWAYHIGMGRMDIAKKTFGPTDHELTAKDLLENGVVMRKLSEIGAFDEDKKAIYPIRLAAAEIVLAG
ncbi:MAG: transglycosylase SLT domain-containing protein [Patescibacteria group bacterium]